LKTVLKELPNRTLIKKESNSGDDMKIAFRYQSLPVLSANNTTAEQFDFGSHISEQTLNSANIQFCAHNSCLNYIKSLPTNEKTVTRVIIEGLGSPLSPIDIESLPKFVFELKSLIRKLPNVLCLITFSAQIINSSNFSYVRSRIHNTVDCVIQLIAFDELTQTPYTEYKGLLNVIKLPKLNSFNYYSIPETLDFGFQLKNNSRFFVVDKLCLPPDLSETVSRTTGCATNQKILDF
jgi:elongator complex protein 4